MSGIKLPKTIKIVITDFDGIVTDNCVYINEDFTMSRKLNFKDVMGFSILKKNGFDIAIISGEKNSAIETMAKKFKIDEIHQNIRNKIEVLKMIIEVVLLNHGLLALTDLYISVLLSLMILSFSFLQMHLLFECLPLLQYHFLEDQITSLSLAQLKHKVNILYLKSLIARVDSSYKK